MGNNTDIASLYEIDNEQKCPMCKEISDQRFYEYDLDCEWPINNGIINLSCFCQECEHEWDFKRKLFLEEVDE